MSTTAIEKLRSQLMPPCFKKQFDDQLLFATFLKHSMNRSSIGPSGGCWPVEIESVRIGGEHYADSRLLFQVTENRKHSIITASGLKSVVRFTSYITPFDMSTWMTLLFLSCMSILIFEPYRRQLQVSDSSWLFLIGTFLESPLAPSRKLEQSRIFRCIILPLVLLSLVLTTGYKDVIITSLVRPFERKGVDSALTALRLGYTLYFEPGGVSGSGSHIQAEDLSPFLTENERKLPAFTAVRGERPPVHFV